MLIIISQYFCRLRSTLCGFILVHQPSRFVARFYSQPQSNHYSMTLVTTSTVFFSLQSFEICPLTLLAPLGMPDGKTSSSHPSVTGQQSCVCCMPGAAASLRNLPISIQMVTSVSIQRVKLWNLRFSDLLLPSNHQNLGWYGSSVPSASSSPKDVVEFGIATYRFDVSVRGITWFSMFLLCLTFLAISHLSIVDVFLKPVSCTWHGSLYFGPCG